MINETYQMYTFGGVTPETIWRYICDVVGNDTEIVLNVGKTVNSISFFKSKVFQIRINSKSQCLDTTEDVCIRYGDRIKGTSLNDNTLHIPLYSDEKSAEIVKEMISELYEVCFARQKVEAFGCCNDHVRCSDVGHCLHCDDKFYLGCQYRKNLELGKIFYGKKRNVDPVVTENKEENG